MKKILLAFSIAALMSGCAPHVVKLTTDISSEEIREIRSKKGENTIKGSAFLRQRGGGVVTCAGQTVDLIPDIPYTRERITTLYGGYNEGFQPIYSLSVKFEPDLSLLIKGIKKSVNCDAQGNFKFTSVPDGAYFITVPVVWEAGTSQGGALMKMVKVNGNEEKEVILSF